MSTGPVVYIKAVTHSGNIVAKQIAKPLPVVKGYVLPPPPLPPKLVLRTNYTPVPLWQNYRIIGDAIKVPGSTKYQVSTGIRDGVRYILIWTFYFKKSDSTWAAGRHGVSIPLIYPINDGMDRITPMHDVLKLVADAIALSKDLPLADTDHEVLRIRKDYSYENL